METLINLKCTALLFDLDGTLVDSTERIARLWRVWGESKGIAYETILTVLHGRRAIETVRLIAPDLNAEDEVAALEADEVADMHDIRLYPGAAELIEKARLGPWAIVTSGSRRVAEPRIRHVGLPLPPVLVTGDDVLHGKPAPDAYLLATRRLGVPAADCIVVEDSPAGLEAGKAAGMRLIAVASTHPRENLKSADVIASRLTDIDLHVEAREIHISIVF